MHKILEQCIGELRVNHTDKEIAGVLSEYFQVVKSVSYDYTDNAAVKDIREDHPELAFMDDDEIEEILEQAKTIRDKRDPQRYRTDGYNVESTEHIYPKEEGWRPVSLREAAEMREIHKEGVFVLFPTDDTRRIYERQTLEEFVKDCKFFIGE